MTPWTFTLDQHDFYCLRLDNETIVYDVYSEQWYVFSTSTLASWRPGTGTNWIGGQVFGLDYGSNILIGDATIGVISFLDPTKEDDDDPADPTGATVPFERMVQGQLVHAGEDYVPCYAVQLIGSMGDNQSPSILTDVTLSVSDDSGNNYVSCGTVTIPAADYNYRVEWNSLGSIRMPGRLFKIVDYGAMLRIDGFELLEFTV